MSTSKRPAGDDTRGDARAWGALSLSATQHAAVDAACAVLLWSAYRDGALSAPAAAAAFLLYNLLAFATQPLLGLVADRIGAGRGTAVAGSLMTAAALALAAVPHLPLPAIVLAGLGNATFHIGGGIMSLRAAPGRAAPVGVFVAPGAAGLLLGILVGKAGGPVWPFAAVLVCLAAGIALVRPPSFSGGAATRAGEGRRRRWQTASGGVVLLIVLLVLLVVGLRSYVGMALALPWKTQTTLLVALTAAVVAGKALGGVLGDRFGWRPVGVGALLVSLPLLAIGAAVPAAGIVGFLVFNMTMPITVAALATVLPRGHEGFAFGLTCLALFVGLLPDLAWPGSALTTPLLAVVGLAAAVALWLGLGRGDGAASTERLEPAGGDAS